MYRFLIFAYDNMNGMHPNGGMHDISLKTNKAHEAIQEWENKYETYGYVEIYDCQTDTLYHNIEEFKQDIK